MAGIVSYGTYLPYARLQRAAITAALGAGGGKGTCSVASYDEDTTPIGAEAARVAMRSAPQDTASPGVVFSTTVPAYLDKMNATAIHAALGLDQSTGAWDVPGSVRSASAAMSLGSSSALSRLVVVSDIRTGLPGGADEAAGGRRCGCLPLRGRPRPGRDPRWCADHGRVPRPLADPGGCGSAADVQASARAASASGT